MTTDKEKVFNVIYHNNAWGSSESKSGPGSTLVQTETLRGALPGFFLKHKINSVLDIPCGDFNWMKLIQPELSQVIDHYVGGDIVADVVESNVARYSDGRFKFELLDLTSSKLPKVDLIFSRDVLVHFSYKDILSALNSIIKSDSRYLLTTSFTNEERENKDMYTGGWRALNLVKYPFCFPSPVDLIVENCTENDGIYIDKSLVLWEIKDISLSKIRLRMLWVKWITLLQRLNRKVVGRLLKQK